MMSVSVPRSVSVSFPTPTAGDRDGKCPWRCHPASPQHEQESSLLPKRWIDTSTEGCEDGQHAARRDNVWRGRKMGWARYYYYYSTLLQLLMSCSEWQVLLYIYNITDGLHRPSRETTPREGLHRSYCASRYSQRPTYHLPPPNATSPRAADQAASPMLWPVSPSPAGGW